MVRELGTWRHAGSGVREQGPNRSANVEISCYVGDEASIMKLIDNGTFFSRFDGTGKYGTVWDGEIDEIVR